MKKKNASSSQESNSLSPVLKNYLEIIFKEVMRCGSARASDIAEAAGVQRSTVTSALRSLRSLGYAKYEPYSPITLTERGLAEGKDIYHRHQVLREFFVKLLLLDEAAAQGTVSRLEHDMPDEVIRRLGQFVLYMTSGGRMKADWLDDYMAHRKELLKGMIEARRKSESTDEAAGIQR